MTKKKKTIVANKGDLNWLAVEISKREGKKVQVNIAQIKEILKVLIEILTEGPMANFTLAVETMKAMVVKAEKKAKKQRL